MGLSELLVRLLEAKIDIGPGILWREVIGNVFGLASALLGMQRRVAAWPIGIIGNILLFTVFVGSALGGVLDTPQEHDVWGQAGRQVFFLALSVYGWVQWTRNRNSRDGGGVAVRPRWATGRERLQLLAGAVVLTAAFYVILEALGSWGPLADAWILTGSILATYGMARGWTDFWLIWVAVDIVGIPLLLVAGFYPSAIMYIVYGAFCVLGLVSWMRIQRTEGAEAVPAGVADPVSETVG